MKPDLLNLFIQDTDTMIELLSELMQIESPTSDKAAVDRKGERIRHELEAIGAEVEVHQREAVGDILVGRWNMDRPGKPILFVCHMDTVHPIGMLARNPVRIEDGLLYGPGACDEIGGIVAMLAALRALRDQSLFPERPVIALMTSDEETGSDHSRDLIIELARQSALALVMEGAMPDGSLKTWRKSPGRFTLRTHGIASHAGGAHESGLNAIEEMAHQVIALQRMTDYKAGSTVSVNIVNGGTASNVVPDLCEVSIDARVITQAELERMTNQIMGLKPVLPGARLSVEGRFDRPPMERNELMIQTFEAARNIGTAYGLTLRESGTGGASDGNYTAAAGVPTLDGIGPTGTGAHTDKENVQIRALSQSAALLAGLLLDWPDTPA
ncbi:MAG: M20 family metallopeptidase [Anaerolineae bacterium]|nr:M20 family metallopeptidase [Anaerolineae bacterium]